MYQEHMDLWCPPEDLISDLSSGILRYRMAHSKEYAALSAARKRAGDALTDVHHQFESLYHDYEVALGNYQSAVTRCFWAHGAFGAATGSPVLEVLSLADINRNTPTTHDVETAELDAHFRFAALFRTLSLEQNRTALQEHFDLQKQDAQAVKPYALLHGYEWMLALLAPIGIQPFAPSDLDAAYQALL